MRTLFLAIALCAAASAQTNSAGVMSEWDVSTLLTNLEKGANQLGSALDQMKPDQWSRAGAPQGYLTQWNIARNEVQYLLGSAKALNHDPERLSMALDALFRMDALDRTLSSLVDATRKYQSRPLADQLQARIGDTTIARDKLRQYVYELAKQKEHEYQVMDSEAQRCRASLAGAARSGTAQRRKTPPSSKQ